MIAIRKFRLVNLRKSPSSPRAAGEKSAGGSGLASPGYVYLPGVPSEFNREQEVRAYLLSEIPGVRRLGLANGQNGNATLVPAAATLKLHLESHIPIFTLRFSVRLFSFCRDRCDEKGGREVDRVDVRSGVASANG